MVRSKLSVRGRTFGNVILSVISRSSQQRDINNAIIPRIQFPIVNNPAFAASRYARSSLRGHCLTQPLIIKCANGFQVSGNSCICPPESHVCNGQCTRFPCPSAIPRSKRSQDLPWKMGRLCPLGEDPCGGYSGPRSYECINTRTTLDSCKWIGFLRVINPELTLINCRRWMCLSNARS